VGVQVLFFHICFAIGTKLNKMNKIFKNIISVGVAVRSESCIPSKVYNYKF